MYFIFPHNCIYLTLRERFLAISKHLLGQAVFYHLRLFFSPPRYAVFIYLPRKPMELPQWIPLSSVCNLFCSCQAKVNNVCDPVYLCFAVLPSCSINEYVCASGGCVSASLRCDGHDNCPDSSDEVCPFCNTFTTQAQTH